MFEVDKRKCVFVTHQYGVSCQCLGYVYGALEYIWEDTRLFEVSYCASRKFIAVDDEPVQEQLDNSSHMLNEDGGSE